MESFPQAIVMGNFLIAAILTHPSTSQTSPAALAMANNSKALTEGPVTMDTSEVGGQADRAEAKIRLCGLRFNPIWDCSSIG